MNERFPPGKLRVEGLAVDVKTWSIVLLILLASFALRVSNLGAQSLWGDEAYSVALSLQPFSTMLEIALDERSHPPLYQVLLHFWLGLGREEFITRAFSAYAGVLTVAVVFAIGQTMQGPRLGILAAFLLASSPFHTWYSQETRPYALAVLTASLAILTFLRAAQNNTKRAWIVYGISTLLALLTTYLALLVVVAQFYFLVLGRRRFGPLLRPWLASTGIAILFFLPWALAILARGGFSAAWVFWIRPALPDDLFWTGYNFSVGQTSEPSRVINLIGAVLFIALLVWASYRSLRAQQGWSSILAWWLFLPWLLVFFISVDWPLPDKKSLYLDRFLSPLLPPALLLAGLGLLQMGKIKWLALAGLLLPSSLSLVNLHSNPFYFRDDWRSAVETISQESGEGDVLLITPHIFPPLTYYPPYPPGEIPREIIPEFVDPNSKEARQFFAYGLQERMTTIEQRADRFWLLVPLDNQDPHGFFQERNSHALEWAEAYPLKTWLDLRYPILQEWLFQGVHLTLYSKS